MLPINCIFHSNPFITRLLYNQSQAYCRPLILTSGAHVSAAGSGDNGVGTSGKQGLVRAESMGKLGRAQSRKASISNLVTEKDKDKNTNTETASTRIKMPVELERGASSRATLTSGKSRCGHLCHV
jgi:hypothetical protein